MLFGCIDDSERTCFWCESSQQKAAIPLPRKESLQVHLCVALLVQGIQEVEKQDLGFSEPKRQNRQGALHAI